MPKKVARRSAQKSQSEAASEKKSKAIERAGAALIEGRPSKAKKILGAQAKRETKKPSAKQAVEVLAEAHTIEGQLTALDHKIDGIKEEYKELKALREKLVFRLRSEVRDMGQGRLPFATGALDVPRGKKATDAKPTSKQKDGSTEAPAESKGDPIDAELSGKSELDQMEGDGAKAEPSAA